MIWPFQSQTDNFSKEALNIYSGAYLWNNLPLEAQQAQSIYLFKS
jgi:hypothetical protein